MIPDPDVIAIAPQRHERVTIEFYANPSGLPDHEYVSAEIAWQPDRRGRYELRITHESGASSVMARERWLDWRRRKKAAA